MKKRGWIILIVVLLVILGGIGAYLKFKPSSNFSINPEYPVNLRLFPGSEATASIDVTNHEEVFHKFNLKSIGLEGIISFSETEFELNPKESKRIQIFLNDVRNDSHVSYGNFIISNNNFEKEIPVLLTFEDQKNLISIIQKPLPKYDNVYPGGKLGMDIRIFDLGIKTFSKEVKVSYEILAPGKTIFNLEEELIVNKEYSFSKIFDIDSKLPYGNYALITSVEYGGVRSISAYLFKIESRKNNFFSDDLSILLAIILIFIVLIIVLFFYFFKSRDELLIQLKKQQSRELERNIKLISSIQKKSPVKEKEKFEKAKKEVAKKIKKKGDRQKKHIEKLIKKKTKKDTIKNEMEKWEKEGYKFPEIKKEIPKKDVHKKILEWKKSGFDTSVLEK